MSVLSPRSPRSPFPFGFIARNLLRFRLPSFFPQPTRLPSRASAGKHSCLMFLTTQMKRHAVNYRRFPLGGHRVDEALGAGPNP
jgi:hypothetical protein